jgi:hypothetical protein
LRYSGLTDSSGEINTDIPEYINNNNSVEYQSPYTLTATKSGYETYTNSTINLTIDIFMNIAMTASSGGDIGGSSSGGGGGGSGGKTYTLTEEQFKQGYTKELAKDDQFKVNISGSFHYVKLVALTEKIATINVSSTPQQALFVVGDESRFDVTGDSVFDLIVKVNNITVKLANVTLKKYVQSSVGNSEEKTKNLTRGAGTEDILESEVGVKSSKGTWILLIILIVIIVIIFLITFILYKKKTNSGNLENLNQKVV